MCCHAGVCINSILVFPIYVDVDSDVLCSHCLFKILPSEIFTVAEKLYTTGNTLVHVELLLSKTKLSVNRFPVYSCKEVICTLSSSMRIYLLCRIFSEPYTELVSVPFTLYYLSSKASAEQFSVPHNME
jgi:hypothetical protein